MSDKRFLHRDDVLGITEFMHFDETGDVIHVETIQDVEPILERNKIDAGYIGNDRWKDGLQHVARIPMVVYNEWKQKGWIDDQAKLKALLNNLDNSFMRTKPGRL